MIGNTLGVLLLAACAQAQIIIPAVGQPSPFYGAAGKGVKIEATATPTEITLDDSILYTLRITQLLNAPDVRRPNLGEVEAFQRDFQIDDEPTSEPEPAGTRVFHYRLRPRIPTLKTIPALVFAYYDPNLPQPADRPEFPYRKARTDPISIQIVAASVTAKPKVPLEVPAIAEKLAEPSASVGAWAWWAGIVVPPILALVACACWWARNPAGTRLARHRRSRAARVALKQLHNVGHGPEGPDAAVECVCQYLAERYDLSSVPRTPAELGTSLSQAGASDETIREGTDFLRAADEARFAPNPVASATLLIADAERLIRGQEGEA
jgi:hypothetical protein